jgi:hypothetical protein
MALDQVIPLTTKEGHQYLIEFFITNELIILPESIDIKIANVAITLISGAGMNNASTLFQISGIMKEYLNQNDVVLYCYCDQKEIARGVKNITISPQRYRSLLFSRMFDRKNDDNFINNPIIIADEVHGDHYIHLISKKSNQSNIHAIEKELMKLNK